MSLPGVKLPVTNDDFAVFYRQKYGKDTPCLIIPHDSGCLAWSDHEEKDLAGLHHAFRLAVSLQSHGIPSACLYATKDCPPQFVFDNLAWHHGKLRSKIETIVNDRHLSWGITKSPKAASLEIGHNFPLRECDGVIRLSSYGINEDAIAAIKGVVSHFHGSEEKLPLRFFSELSPNRISEIMAIFDRHDIPVYLPE